MNNRQLNRPLLLVIILFISGCELLGPDIHQKLLLEDLKQDKNTEIVYPELANESEGNKEKNEAKVELYPGTDNFLSRDKKKLSRSGISGKGEYSLNFDGADLSEVVKVILSDILGENYVFSPKVSGSVTLQTTRPLSRVELLPTLEMLLDINNAALVYDGSIYKINPTVEAINGSVLIGGGSQAKGMKAGYQIRVVPIRNVSVEELSEIVKPLLKDKTILHVDSSRNMMLIAGTPSELARAMDMVNSFDVDVMKGKSFGLFPLRNVDAEKVMEELEQIFNKNSSGADSGFIQFMQIERLNAILAIVHQAKSLKDIERWIYRLDRANSSAGGGAIVYRVQHVDAVELAATLNEIFAQSSSKAKPTSIAAGRKSVEVTNKKRDVPKKPERSPVRRKVASTSSIEDLGDVKIIADEVNNALIIVATAQDYAVVQQVIKQLDIMPLQVLIDATIIEVTLTDELQYGIQWFLSHKNDYYNGAASSGGFDLSGIAADLAVGAATGGFGYGFVSDSGDIRAVVDASATDGKVNIISSPSLMVLNNHEAFIQVGDEVPIRTSQSTNLNNSDGIETSSIEQRQTGVKLKIKPRVNASGLVIMDIEQSVENVVVTQTSGIDSPTIATREITSSVAVQNGETIVLGGLIRDDNTFNKNGIPLLHEIPLIGPLFGNTTKNKRKTELVVLITPRVVRSKQDARLITNEFKRKLSDIYEISEEEVIN